MYLCGREIIAMYPKNTEFKIYYYECWWSDKWNQWDTVEIMIFQDLFSNNLLIFKKKCPELDLKKEMWLIVPIPMPRLCPNCRHYQRLKQRNPLKLWKRKCMCGGQSSVNGIYKNTIKHFHGSDPCPNEFQTTYALDRPEIVYCERYYLQEVV